MAGSERGVWSDNLAMATGGGIAAAFAGERPEIPLSCPRSLANFIKECWHQDYTKRPSFAECQEHLKELNQEP